MTRDQVDLIWLIVFCLAISHMMAGLIGYSAAMGYAIEVVTPTEVLTNQ